MYKLDTVIDPIHKWQLNYYSFIFILISLRSLVSMCKIKVYITLNYNTL